MNESIVQRTVGKWKSENLDSISSYSETQVKTAFDKIGKPVSKDIIQVYTTLGSMTENEIDSNLLSFWSLDELVNKNLKFKTDFVLFGDFLIFSHLYGYKDENENVSSVYSDFETGEYLKIAGSVEEFFDLYLNDPFQVGLYKE